MTCSSVSSTGRCSCRHPPLSTPYSPLFGPTGHWYRTGLKLRFSAHCRRYPVQTSPLMCGQCVTWLTRAADISPGKTGAPHRLPMSMSHLPLYCSHPMVGENVCSKYENVSLSLRSTTLKQNRVMESMHA